MKAVNLATLLLRVFCYGIGVVALFGLFVTWAMSRPEGRTFESQWRQGFQAADRVLLANGLCTTNHECRDKNTMYWRGLDKGFKIYIYGIQDQVILGQLAEIFATQFTTIPTIRRLVVVAYPFPKSAEIPFISAWTQGAILEINMRRSK